MVEMGSVSPDDLVRFERKAETRGKDFNPFNMILLERRPATFNKEGKPDDSSRSVFPERGSVRLDPDNLLTLIDTPGYSRFIDNIVYGMYLADLALLVVEAQGSVTPVTEDIIRGLRLAGSRSEINDLRERLRKAGVESGAIAASNILASFAIPAIAVLVTKMDLIGYSQLLFDEISTQINKIIVPLLSPYLGVTVPIIPVSALTGVGFGSSEDSRKEMPWYDGPTALEVISSVKSKKGPSDVKAVRFAVKGPKEIYRTGVGTVLVGSLETGVLKTNDKLIIEPASTIAKQTLSLRVGSLRRPKPITESEKIEVEESVEARAIVAISAKTVDQNFKEVNYDQFLRHGGVLGTADDRPTVAEEIMADIIFFEPDTVYSGKEYTILANASRSTATIVEIEKGEGILYNLETEKYDAGASERSALDFVSNARFVSKRGRSTNG